MKKNWDIDFDNFTILIDGDITAQDCGGIMNAMVNHERAVVKNYHNTHKEWKVVTNVSEKLENDESERPSNESV